MRPNGEHIGPKDARRRLVVFASGFRFEMEAIWASFQDLAKMAHCGVKEA
jgi:hypothetical protein